MQDLEYQLNGRIRWGSGILSRGGMRPRVCLGFRAM